MATLAVSPASSSGEGRPTRPPPARSWIRPEPPELIGWAAGASFVVLDAGNPHEVTAWSVVSASVLPLVLGTGLAALLARWWPGFLRLAQVIGGALALLTVAGPVMSDTDGATRLALVIMHVVAGVAVVASLESMRRRITSDRPS